MSDSIEKTIAEKVSAAVLAEVLPLLKYDRFMPEEEAMAQLGCSKSSMRKYRAAGLVAYQPMGQTFYYFQRDLDAFVKRNGRAL